MCLLKSRSVPKTTSVKIARAWCRKGYLADTLDVVHRWQGKEGGKEAGGAANHSNEEAGGSRYSPVATFDADAGGASADGSLSASAARSVSPSSITPTGVVQQPPQGAGAGARQTLEEVRATDATVIMGQLSALLLQIAMQSPTGAGNANVGIDPDVELSSIGFDSMTLNQFHGVLDNRFYCDNIPVYSILYVA